MIFFFYYIIYKHFSDYKITYTFAVLISIITFLLVKIYNLVNVYNKQQQEISSLKQAIRELTTALEAVTQQMRNLEDMKALQSPANNFLTYFTNNDLLLVAGIFLAVVVGSYLGAKAGSWAVQYVQESDWYKSSSVQTMDTGVQSFVQTADTGTDPMMRIFARQDSASPLVENEHTVRIMVDGLENTVCLLFQHKTNGDIILVSQTGEGHFVTASKYISQYATDPEQMQMILDVIERVTT